MLKHLLKGMLATLAIKLLNDYRNVSLQLLKIEATKCYLQGMLMARLSALGLMRMGLFIALIGVGVLIFHAGLFMLLPWSVETRAILGMCLGLIYALLGAVALHRSMSEKKWMKKSGAADMLHDVAGRATKDRPADVARRS